MSNKQHLSSSLISIGLLLYFAVVQAYGVCRSIAAYAAFYMDLYYSRYSTSTEALKAIVGVCIHLAFKLHQHKETLSFRALQHSLRYTHSVQVLEETEHHLMEALDWRVHPPIPESIASYYLTILTECYPPHAYEMVHRDVVYCLDQAMVDDFFLGYAPSVLTMAAFCVAIGGLQRDHSDSSYPHPIDELARRTNIVIPLTYFEDCRGRIVEVLAQCRPQQTSEEQDLDPRVEMASPVSVQVSFPPPDTLATKTKVVAPTPKRP